MRRMIIALVTAALLTVGAVASALAQGPDDRACGTPALGNLQAAFLLTDPCVSHQP